MTACFKVGSVKFRSAVSQKMNFYQPINLPAKVSPPFQGGDRMFLKLVLKILRRGYAVIHEKGGIRNITEVIVLGGEGHYLGIE